MEKCFQGRFLINPVFLFSIILFNSGRNKKLSPGGAARQDRPSFFVQVGERNDGAYSAPYPEPGTMSLDPVAEWDWIFCKRFPAVIWGNVVGNHGPGGICRPADAKHPGKRKNAGGESLLSLAAFFGTIKVLSAHYYSVFYF